MPLDMKRTLAQVRADLVFKALDPEDKRFLSAVSLPPRLNAFARYGIDIAALIPFKSFPHIKTVPVVQMMLEDFAAGRYRGKHTVVVDSSGNTAHAVARLAPAFGFREIKVVVAADIPDSKKGILAALSSVDLIEVGGGKSVSARAKEEARKAGHYHLNQYAHRGNIRAHERYTGPEVLGLLGDRLAAIAVAMGSGGTVAGVGRFLKRRRPGVVVLGVRPAPGEQIPGARDKKRMEAVVTLPWEKAVDGVYEVGRKESFIRMRRLWSAVEPQPGPTSGLAWGGLERYLAGLGAKKLKKLRGKCAAFICPDDGRFYSERTTGELDPDQGLEGTER